MTLDRHTMTDAAADRARKDYKVELHYKIDIFSHNYGKDKGCADRAVQRLCRHLDWDGLREIRVWHDGKCIESMTPPV